LLKAGSKEEENEKTFREKKLTPAGNLVQLPSWFSKERMWELVPSERRSKHTG